MSASVRTSSLDAARSSAVDEFRRVVDGAGGSSHEYVEPLLHALSARLLRRIAVAPVDQQAGYVRVGCVASTRLIAEHG